MIMKERLIMFYNNKTVSIDIKNLRAFFNANVPYLADIDVNTCDSDCEVTFTFSPEANEEQITEALLIITGQPYEDVCGLLDEDDHFGEPTQSITLSVQGYKYAIEKHLNKELLNACMVEENAQCIYFFVAEDMSLTVKEESLYNELGKLLFETMVNSIPSNEEYHGGAYICGDFDLASTFVHLIDCFKYLDYDKLKKGFEVIARFNADKYSALNNQAVVDKLFITAKRKLSEYSL